MAELNERLSERELEILRLVATGAANKEIAHQLVISPNTVKVHVRNIFDKIGVSSRTEATLYAIKIGLVKHQSIGESDGDEGTLASISIPAETVTDGAATGAPALPIIAPQPETDSIAKPQKHLWRQPWVIGLLVILALFLLIGSGMLGAELLVTPTPPPTVASISTAQVQLVNAPRWARKAGLPAARKGMGIAEYENGIYILGGETSQGVDGAVLRYDETKNDWSTLLDKITPVTDVHAALVGEKIYVPGGIQADGFTTNRLEVFDPRKNVWERKADLPVPISAYSLVTFEGRLYLFGGKNGSQYSASIYIYSPQEDRWNKGASMSSPRAYAAAIENGGKIFLMGGYDGQQALKLNEAYIPSRDTGESDESPWKILTPLPDGRYAMGAAQLASMVFLMGGLSENGQLPTKAALQYTIQSDQWAEYDKPPVQVGGYLALISSGDYLFIFGGQTAQGLSANNLSYRAIYTNTVPIMINDGKP
jgi:DNA-binding CsgD family transcriptional regulator